MRFLAFIFLFYAYLAAGATPGLGEYHVKWRNKSPSICFADRKSASALWFSTYKKITHDNVEAFTEEEKNTIRETLQENFTAADTGIEFVGFHDCSTKGADVHIAKFEYEGALPSNAWVRFIGENGIAYCPSGAEDCQSDELFYDRANWQEQQYIAIRFEDSSDRKVSNLERLKIILLHEMGHVAGLRHEHIRKESLNDRNCDPWKSVLFKESLHYTSVFGDYDPNSVMSYCYLLQLMHDSGLEFETSEGEELPIVLKDNTIFEQKNTGTNLSTKIRITLSSGDKHALRCLYLYDLENFERLCRHSL